MEPGVPPVDVPVVDLAPLRDGGAAAVGRKIEEACAGLGLFYVVRRLPPS
jgi:hypothetical protein